MQDKISRLKFQGLKIVKSFSSKYLGYDIMCFYRSAARLAGGLCN